MADDAARHDLRRPPTGAGAEQAANLVEQLLPVPGDRLTAVARS